MCALDNGSLEPYPCDDLEYPETMGDPVSAPSPDAAASSAAAAASEARAKRQRLRQLADAVGGREASRNGHATVRAVICATVGTFFLLLGGG